MRVGLNSIVWARELPTRVVRCVEPEARSLRERCCTDERHAPTCRKAWASSPHHAVSGWNSPPASSSPAEVGGRVGASLQDGMTFIRSSQAAEIVARRALLYGRR